MVAQGVEDMLVLEEILFFALLGIFAGALSGIAMSRGPILSCLIVCLSSIALYVLLANLMPDSYTRAHVMLPALITTCLLNYFRPKISAVNDPVNYSAAPAKKNLSSRQPSATRPSKKSSSPTAATTASTPRVASTTSAKGIRRRVSFPRS